MAIDGLTLAAVAADLQKLINGRVDKIQQPERDELILTIRAGGENHRLLLCASGDGYRVQLTFQKRVSPLEAPAFCMLARRRLGGARVTGIFQPNMDRVLVIALETLNEMGDAASVNLAVEMMGKHSNVILIDGEGVIIDALRRVTASMSTVRLILPGVRYAPPPPQPKMNPVEATPADFENALRGDLPVARALSARFFGLAPSMAERLVNSFLPGTSHTGQLTDSDRYLLADRLYGFYQDARKGVFHPCLILDEMGRPASLLPFSPVGLGERAKPVTDIGEALDSIHESVSVRLSLRRKSASLLHALRSHTERVEKNLARYSEAIGAQEKIGRYRLFGELITANLSSITRGLSECTALNYYTDPPEMVRIPLDPRLSPNENAQSYFKKYRKSQTAREMALTRRAQALGELNYLEGQLDNLEKCETENELLELKEELIREGYIRPERKKNRAQRREASKPMHFVSSSGFDIYVGKNNTQNDYLTLRLASPSDIWLHTKDIPGSHVIIRNGESAPESTIIEAALLAAYYSKAKHGENVPVDYALKRFVKKPSGAKPGMVIYTNNHTLYITPEEARVRALEGKATSR